MFHKLLNNADHEITEFVNWYLQGLHVGKFISTLILFSHYSYSDLTQVSGVPRGGGLGCSNPPRNSEDIGGVLDRMSKKSQHLDFLLQFTVFSYGCNLLNKCFLLIQTVLQWRIWFRSSNPPRHSESLTKSNRNAN